MEDILMFQQVVYKTTALCRFKDAFSKWGCTSRMTGCDWVMHCKLCGQTLGSLISATEETRHI